MCKKKLVRFQLADGSPVLAEVEDLKNKANPKPQQAVSEIGQAQTSFVKTIEPIRPAAEAVLNIFRQMNTPKEITLEFGIKLNESTGAVFTLMPDEANFKVTLKWQN